MTTDPMQPQHSASPAESGHGTGAGHHRSGEADRPAITPGRELAWMIRQAALAYEALATDDLQAVDLTGPRFFLLMRLYHDEKCHGPRGLSPTYLSQCQKVSKNTISSLLRGLEAQGLVERAVDLADKRRFLLRLTDAGRELVRETGPRHLAKFEETASVLSDEEAAATIDALRRLVETIRQRLGVTEF